MSSAGSDVFCASTECHSRLLSEGDGRSFCYFFVIFLGVLLTPFLLDTTPLIYPLAILDSWKTDKVVYVPPLRTNESDSEMKLKVTPSISVPVLTSFAYSLSAEWSS